MCQNWTTYIPGIEWNKDTSVLPQEPSFCLNDSVAPLPPVASAKQNQQMNGRFFPNTHFFAKWSLRRLRGHFNWPFSTAITLRSLNEHGTDCHKRVNNGPRGGDFVCVCVWVRVGWDGGGGRDDEWVDHNNFWRRPLHPHRGSSNYMSDSSTRLLHPHPPSARFIIIAQLLILKQAS